jgi:hypothetical protein
MVASYWNVVWLAGNIWLSIVLAIVEMGSGLNLGYGFSFLSKIRRTLLA